MTAADVIAALELPPSARVNQRVPKKLLVENGAPTATDKRRINEGVEEIHWLAALKPGTIGVPEYRDETREYLEIAVLRMTVRPDAQTGRIAELVHRAVPYPVLLITEAASSVALSLAHKRWSQSEAGKTVLDGDVVDADLADMADDRFVQSFQAALPLARQPRATLVALYQGWMDVLLALHAARLTGTFVTAPSAEHAAARRDALHECAQLEARIVTLRVAAEKERQVARQVELNLELMRVHADHSAARARL